MSTYNQSNSCVEYATTPVEQLRGEQHSDVYISDWATYHDVSPWLLPFKHRDCDRLAIGLQIADEWSDLPETAATFTKSNLSVSGYTSSMVDPFLFARGARVHTNKASRPKRYHNPNYIHYDTQIDPITDKQERIDFYNKFISVGTLEPRWIAKHFGICTYSLTRYIMRHTDSLPPRERRRQNMRRLAKSAITATSWSDYTKTDIARMIGIPRTTLVYHINQVLKTDWQPPRCPDGNSWFEPSTDEDASLPQSDGVTP